MIDLHTHILPKVDDGAGSVEEAFQLIQLLRKQDVSKIVCTPHFDPTKLSLEDFISRRKEAMQLLVEAEVPLLVGSETMLHEFLFYYPELDRLCIENSRYLLLELPPGDKWTKSSIQLLERLISTYDVIPIIAHVERYHRENKGLKFIHKLIHLGCIIQMNTSSIADRNYRKQAMHIMKSGLIDVLGSDCHSLGKRPPIIMEALEIITRELGTDYCNILLGNAEHIINGTYIRQKNIYII